MATNGFTKKKNDVLPFEEIELGVLYAITFNPCDKYQYFKDAFRLTKCIKDLTQTLFYSMSVYSFAVISGIIT